jgi:cytoskeleton protein RodZ
MPEVGATLREARMRERIDITDMEVRTKIRAKYLRALENEEWDLLPGPTYVRSFLRTYADALGLDSRALVEEYKLRHEGLATGELHPIRPPSARERDRRRRRDERAGVPIAAVVGFILAAIVAGLVLIGNLSSDDEDPSESTVPPPMTTETTERAAESEREKPKPPAKPKVVRLRLDPTGPVSVCLVDATGKILIANEILQPGQSTRTFRSRRFRLVLGNNAVSLRINGKARTVPPSSGVIAYSITRQGRKDLPEGSRPTCAPA